MRWPHIKRIRKTFQSLDFTTMHDQRYQYVRLDENFNDRTVPSQQPCIYNSTWQWLEFKFKHYMNCHGFTGIQRLDWPAVGIPESWDPFKAFFLLESSYERMAFDGLLHFLMRALTHVAKSDTFSSTYCRCRRYAFRATLAISKLDVNWLRLTTKLRLGVILWAGGLHTLIVGKYHRGVHLY